MTLSVIVFGLSECHYVNRSYVGTSLGVSDSTAWHSAGQDRRGCKLKECCSFMQSVIWCHQIREKNNNTRELRQMCVCLRERGCFEGSSG